MTSAGRRLTGLRARALFARVAALAALGAGLSVGCAPPPSERAADPPAERPPDIVVFMVDTLRADEIGCYGAEITKTPNIDRFAAQSTLFRRASAPSASTRPSIASLMTGVAPDVHGVHDLGGMLPLDPHDRLVRLPELLAERGYRVMGLVANPNVDRTFGFEVGFESYEGLYERRTDLRPAMAQDLVTDAAGVVDAVVTLLDDVRDDPRPKFLFVLAIDPHAPYTPPLEYARAYDPEAEPKRDGKMRAVLEFDRQMKAGLPVTPDRLLALYRGEVSYLDEHFGRLLAVMAERGDLDRTLVAFTADHGEEFLEHGGRGHGQTVYEEVTHIPLIVRLPGTFEAGIEVDEEVDLLDLAATLVKVAGGDLPSDWTGRDLTGPDLEPRPVLSSNIVRAKQARAVRWEGFKLVDAIALRNRELYNLGLDPAEQAPLSPAAAPEIATGLAGMLDSFEAESRSAQARIFGPKGPPRIHALPPEMEQRLRALGYVD